MSDETTTAPTIPELEAKRERLANDVKTAQKALDVAKKTFADAATADPTAVEKLLELANGVKTAEGTIMGAERAAKSNETAIEGIRYDEQMSGVVEACMMIQDDIRAVVVPWRDIQGELIEQFAIGELVINCKLEESGAVTVSVKPGGEKLPKRPSTARGGVGGGPRGKRSVTVNGVSMSCREYVASCGDEASPAAQADLRGEWDGSPVSYTNEAKRLAAKRGDTFA